MDLQVGFCCAYCWKTKLEGMKAYQDDFKTLHSNAYNLSSTFLVQTIKEISMDYNGKYIEQVDSALSSVIITIFGV